MQLTPCPFLSPQVPSHPGTQVAGEGVAPGDGGLGGDAASPQKVSSGGGGTSVWPAKLGPPKCTADAGLFLCAAGL